MPPTPACGRRDAASPPRRTVLRALLGGALATTLPNLGAYAAEPKPAAKLPTVARDRSFTIATDDTSSTYYTVGVNLAALTQMRLPPEFEADFVAETTLGSWDNALRLRAGKADFAIMQALFGRWARDGSGVFTRFGPDPGLRAVVSLWPDVEHFLLQAKLASTGTIEDLRNLGGAPFAVGASGSAVEASCYLTMRRLGMDPKTTIQATNLVPSEGAAALMMGDVVGMSLPGGPPIPLVDAILSRDVAAMRLLEFTDRQLRLIDNNAGLWRRYMVPAGTYAGQEKPLASIAQSTFLAVRASVPNEIVQGLTQVIFENLNMLRYGHPAANAISLASAFDGLPVPLHPGAAQYFASAGLAIPKPLAPPA